jgi:hypothetical protein
LGTGLPTFVVIGIFVGRWEYLATNACAAAASEPPEPPDALDPLDPAELDAADVCGAPVLVEPLPLELHPLSTSATAATRAPTRTQSDRPREVHGSG